MEGRLHSLSQDKRLRNHLNVDKKRRSNQHWQSSSHFHPYYEMYFMEEGSCKFFVKENVYSLNTGDFLLIPPGELHLASYDQEGFHDRYTVYFDLEMFPPSLFPYLPFRMEDTLAPLHSNIREDFRSDIFLILARMLEAFRMNTEYGDLLNEHLFPLLMMFLSRHTSPIEAGKQQTETERSMAKATRYLAAHYKEAITLEDAAAVAGFSPSYYSRKFKEIVGISFREYLTHLRLREASMLLRNSSLSVREISDSCGFTSANYFGDVFKSMYHTSPREYRRMEEVM